MGSSRRPRPKYLGRKLRQIRKGLGLTQEQMAERLKKTPSPPQPAHISRFEQSSREPSLLVLLAYARLAHVAMEVLVDDELALPKRFSAAQFSKRN